jgi:hypothetical protein
MTLHIDSTKANKVRSREVFEPHEFCLHVLHDKGLGYRLVCVHQLDLTISLGVNYLRNIECK